MESLLLVLGTLGVVFALAAGTSLINSMDNNRSTKKSGVLFLLAVAFLTAFLLILTTR